MDWDVVSYSIRDRLRLASAGMRAESKTFPWVVKKDVRGANYDGSYTFYSIFKHHHAHNLTLDSIRPVERYI